MPPGALPHEGGGRREAPARDREGVPPAGPATHDGPGLYLHLPFCSAICPYCDFAVLTGDRERRRRFVASLRREIEIAAHDPWPGVVPPPAEPFDTIYFGGGTPSLLAPDELAGIVAELRRRLPVDARARIFLEANPEDVDRERVAAWRRLGVGTLSLGVQSFAADRLAFLGRRHDPGEARRSVELAREAGFETLSLDLIYGLPGEPEEAWRRELEAAVDLAPDHLSCYQLTIHEGTAFGTRRRLDRLTELPEPAQAHRFRLTHRLLAERGYPAYEVSNFSRSPGHRSRHNRKYWNRVPYLGLGPSAHSFAGRRRWWNERRTGRWEERVGAGERPLGGAEELSAEERALERLMLGLRTVEGVDLGTLESDSLPTFTRRNEPAIERLCRAGLLRRQGPRLLPTLDGLAHADGLAAAFDLTS